PPPVRGDLRSQAVLCHSCSSLLRATVQVVRDRLGLVQKAAPVGVLKIEDRVERPVEVIGDPGRLGEQRLRGRPRHSPRRPSSTWLRSTSNVFEHCGHVTDPTTSPPVLSRSHRRCSSSKSAAYSCST